MADGRVNDPLEQIAQPCCPICGEPLAGFEGTFLKLPVQARYSPVFNEVIFVVDPDVPLIVQPLPNGQLVIRLRDVAGARTYTDAVHINCEMAMMAEYYGDYGISDPETRDEETLRDECFLEG